MKKMTGKNTLMLFLTAFIWGTAFVAQSVGMDYIGPFTFTCVRSLIGGIFLIPCICFLDKWRAKNDGAERQKKADRKEEKKNVILGGICCGLALCGASNLTSGSEESPAELLSLQPATSSSSASNIQR